MNCCKDKVYVDVWLPYYKQGDDLHSCLEGNAPWEAMRKHANMLGCAQHILENISTYIEGQEVEVHADTHHIGLEVSKELADILVKEKLATFSDWGDEEDEGCCGHCGCGE